MIQRVRVWAAAVILGAMSLAARGAAPDWITSASTPGDVMAAEYFAGETDRIANSWLQGVERLEDWEARRPEKERDLRWMLGLEPLPERTELKATVTGTVDMGDYVVEKLHYQSMPGLYVTANLWRPKVVEGKLPAVLYVCGHANAKTADGVSLGAKAAYQRHGAWYARHGYVCLVIDTLQLAEIEGIHHGTHHFDRWWWWNRGYTPLGVEVWNSMRGIDYLLSRPEVDAERIGITGRSGGGAYSWYTLALDERIKAGVPTAGIVDLEGHVVDQVVRGHCDCMYHINALGWDFTEVAALCAPRPTLVGQGDVDPIFPMNGVYRLFYKVGMVYGLYGDLGNWGVLRIPGGHVDTPELKQMTYEWMGRELKGEELTEVDPAESVIEPEKLKVFDSLPADEINTKIDQLFVAPAEEPPVPANERDWAALQADWEKKLAEWTFAGWPKEAGELNVKNNSGKIEFTSQAPWRLTMRVAKGTANKPERVRVVVGEDKDGSSATNGEWTVYLEPRGIGATAWTEHAKSNGMRRSFMLLGQTWEGMQVYDVKRGIAAVREVFGDVPLTLSGEGVFAGIALHAAIGEPAVDQLELTNLPATHDEGPILLNVRRIFDMPQAVAMALENGRTLTLRGVEASAFEWTRS